MAAANPINQEFLVVFSEIDPLVEQGQDFQCKFYLQSGHDISQDKIGLYRMGWTSIHDPALVKEVQSSKTDEFNERRVTFNGQEMPDDIYNKYQFNYFHFDGNTQTYHLKGQSNYFNFFKRAGYSPSQQYQNMPALAPPPGQPQTTTPQCNTEERVQNQTSVKRLYDPNNGQILPQNREDVPRNPFHTAIGEIGQRLSEKERELCLLKQTFEYQDKLKDQEIEKLRKTVQVSEEKLKSYDVLLQQNELAHHKQNEMLSHINSINEKLRMTEGKAFHFEKKCAELETEIDRLNTELAISQSQLEQFNSSNLKAEISVQKNRSTFPILQEGLHDKNTINQSLEKDFEKINIKHELEINHLKNNLDELKKKLDSKDEYCIELKAQLRAQELMAKGQDDNKCKVNKYIDLIVESRRQINNIKIFEGQMDDSMREFCINLSSIALKSHSNIKSMTDSIVTDMDRKYSRKWHCLMGYSFEHSDIIHEFGTYLSFAINELRIIVYKTEETVNTRGLLYLAKTLKNVKLINKSQNVDKDVEEYVVSLLKSNDSDFENYSELSTHLTQILSLKYGTNWFAVCGQSDRFDSTLPFNNKLIKIIELKMERIKIIIMQLEEGFIMPMPRSSIKSTNILGQYKC